MLQEMAEAARWFDSHRELRVVIVSGAGRAFCAGADLKDSPAAAAARLDHSWLYRREVGQYGLRAADALEQMRAITIAQVHGYVVGGLYTADYVNNPSLKTAGSGLRFRVYPSGTSRFSLFDGTVVECQSAPPKTVISL